MNKVHIWSRGLKQRLGVRARPQPSEHERARPQLIRGVYSDQPKGAGDVPKLWGELGLCVEAMSDL